MDSTQIEVTFTHPQVMAMQFDAIGELKFVRSTKTTMTFTASREIWEREASMCDCFASSSGEWTPGYGRSASSAGGRIVKALNKALK